MDAFGPPFPDGDSCVLRASLEANSKRRQSQPHSSQYRCHTTHQCINRIEVRQVSRHALIERNDRTLLLDHPREPANLSFYPVEPLGSVGLDSFLMSDTYPHRYPVQPSVRRNLRHDGDSTKCGAKTNGLLLWRRAVGTSYRIGRR